MPPRRRRRPIRPTAEHLDHFTSLERDWIHRTPDAVPVRRRPDRAAMNSCGAVRWLFVTNSLGDSRHPFAFGAGLVFPGCLRLPSADWTGLSTR
jgi:hypothetical protein